MTRRYGVRLSAEGARAFEAEFQRTGKRAEDAMRGIQRAAAPASTGLRVFNAAAGQARDSLEGLASRAGPVASLARVLGPGGLLGGAAVGGLIGLGAAAKNAANEIAQIGDAADRAQIDVDVYEELGAALTIVGQSSNGLESSLSSLVRKTGEARAGIGEAAKVFEQLGVTLTNANGSRKSDAELIDEIADAFARLPDGATRAAFAQKLFEEGGRSLVSVLGEGSAALRDYVEQAREAGALLGGELIRSAQEVNAQFGIQSQVVGVQLKRAFLEAAPAIASLGENLRGLVPPMLEFLSTVVAGVNEMGALVGLAERPLRVQLSTNIEDLRKVQNEIATLSAEEGGMFEGIRRERLRSLREEEAALSARNRELSDLLDAEARANRIVTPDVTLPEFRLPGGGASDLEKEAEAFERLIAASGQRTIGLIDQAELLGKVGEEAAFLEERFRLINAAVQQGVTLDDARIARIEAEARGYAAQASALDGLTAAQKLLTESQAADLTVAEQVAAERERLTALLPFLTELTHDQAEAERVLADALARSATDIEEKAARSTGALGDIRGGLKSVLTGSASLEQGFTGALNRMADRLLDFALDPAFDLIARNLAGLGGGAGGGGFFGSLFGAIGGLFAPSAKGNVFGPSGLTAFANGGVVDGPTFFPFRGGLGLMGEAGPEAILPLSRLPGGALGVRAEGAGGGGAVVNITVTVDASGAREPQAVADKTGQAVLQALINAGVDARLVRQMSPGGLLDRRFDARRGI
ncbi:MAG: phage tail tape measure protein [Pikeienuella sp.]|uniref:phage tail tape measure protein n=1 Tax=Pikeienuella sp. TaxID=2831957 RepID=UPI00391AC3B6